MLTFLTSGEMERLGIYSLFLNPQLAAQLRPQLELGQLELNDGMFVVAVMPGSPAYE